MRLRTMALRDRLESVTKGGWRYELRNEMGAAPQPARVATNADRGGTCQQVNVVPAEQNLHYAWDDAVIAVLERRLGATKPEATAQKLETLYPAAGDLAKWKPGESEQIIVEVA